MGRVLRVDAGGLVYHVLNRASARVPLFEGLADYQQFEQVLAEAQARTGMRLLVYCRCDHAISAGAAGARVITGEARSDDNLAALIRLERR